MSSDIGQKEGRGTLPSEGVYSDGLNKIHELPEEYEKLPRFNKA
eukprot:CAMPEP_0185617530 /NCGR_PEP_ID=MMETSP0436-20130131/43828_1 /TAXON_ID=626734 ORGANISM="Favella taraikaensis, Strain Fe Narragansett Bay" /NCGR_SAMPLE_ID=MMETSP0436 /ASSEMBLY_ACC=CAM_ASM_000390 /LENGTH=43 /DNA_ID= /DNA_START= /DNA_END= /DNA_ORIENTATION=